MKLYRVKEWDYKFENNRTRELKALAWVPIPNSHDGDGYTAIMSHPNGAALYGAWIAAVQVASRCDPRGTLLRGNKKPHDAATLARMTRIPEETVRAMLLLVSSSEVGWLEVSDLPEDEPNAAHNCDNPAPICGDTAGRCLEQKGTEGNGKERKEQNGREYHSDSRAALHILNETAGKHYRETDANLKFISARLNEDGVTLDGVKQMIARQCALWKTDVKMSEFLRPETLFNATKFGAYYDNRDQPIPTAGRNSGNYSRPLTGAEQRAIGTETPKYDDLEAMLEAKAARDRMAKETSGR